MVALTETSTALPYGLRDVKVTALTQGATGYDLPNSRTFSFEEAEDFEELRGDDKVVATRGKGAVVNWSLESGGVSLGVYKTLNGGTITLSGTAGASAVKYRKKVTDARPEFKVEGQAISESGGDFHVVLYRCKANGSLSGTLEDGSFWLTGAEGVALAVPSTDSTNADVLYDFIYNEAATPIA